VSSWLAGLHSGGLLGWRAAGPIQKRSSSGCSPSESASSSSPALQSSCSAAACAACASCTTTSASCTLGFPVFLVVRLANAELPPPGHLHFSTLKCHHLHFVQYTLSGFWCYLWVAEVVSLPRLGWLRWKVSCMCWKSAAFACNCGSVKCSAMDRWSRIFPFVSAFT
jgi:hypothetical protein